MNESRILTAEDRVLVGPDRLFADFADGASALYRAAGGELERLEWKLKIVRDVDAWRERRAA